MYELLITSTSTFLMPVRVCQLVTRLTKPHNTFYPLEHEHIRCALCLSFVQVWVKLWLSTFATHAQAFAFGSSHWNGYKSNNRRISEHLKG